MWIVKAKRLDGIVTVINTDMTATPTTDYHSADALARSVLKSARLYAKGTTKGRAIRCYYADCGDYEV